jgi:hypothetical protein
MQRRHGSAKNPRTVAGSFCRRRSAEMTLLLRSSRLVTPVLPMRSCSTFFQTHSSGLSSGEYPGRKNSLSQPSVEAANAVVGALVHGEPQRALGADRGEHVEREPGAGGAHHRGAPDRRPGCSPNLASHPIHRLAVQPQRGRHLLRMRTGLSPLDRPQPQHLERPMTQLPAVVLAHPQILSDPSYPSRSTYELLSMFAPISARRVTIASACGSGRRRASALSRS